LKPSPSGSIAGSCHQSGKPGKDDSRESHSEIDSMISSRLSALAASGCLAFVLAARADPLPPEITLTSPAAGLLTSDATVLVAGQVTVDPSATPASVTVNDVPVTVEPDGTFSYTMTLVEGWNPVTAVVTDAAQQTAYATADVTQDTEAPTISYNDVSDGMVTNQPFTPGCWAGDEHLLSFTVTLDGSSFTCDTTINAPEGSHVLHFRAEDEVGHVTEIYVTFAVDLTPPVITVSGVQDGTTVPGPVTAVISISDLHLAAYAVWYDDNWHEEFQNGDAITFNTVGEHSIFVTCHDGAFNDAEQWVNFTISEAGASPPTWSSGSALSATAASNTSALFTWTAATDPTGVTGYRFYRDGTLVQTLSGTTLSTTVTTLTLGVQSTFQVQAGNAAGIWSGDGPATTYIAVPPDLTLIAPAVNRSVPTTLFDSTFFIYSGPNAVQIGVPAGAIAQMRAAAIRGTIHTRAGDPIPAVIVSVKNHLEYGWTLSRQDGTYDLVVNGGGPLVLELRRTDFLPLQRQVTPAWAEYTDVGDAIMIPHDAAASLIDLSQTSISQAARSSVSEDANGARRATVIFPPGTSATLTLLNGNTQSASTLHVRATEFTVGPQGPAAMPLELPKTSAYTYAVAFTVDETGPDGGKVTFSQPVFGYVENFLGFPIGAPVPSGYHDTDKAVWLPEDDGKVIRILSVSTGRATIDIDGSGTAATSIQLAALDFSNSELDKLATLYTAGQELWRVPMTHFSARDWNYPPAPPLDGRPPTGEPQTATPAQCSHEVDGSIIECENQTLGERLRLTGVPYTLNYRSDRVRGRRAPFQVVASIPDSGCWDEPSLTNYVDPICGRARVWVRSWAMVSTAGQVPQIFDGFFTGGVVSYEWDGRDRFGRDLQGSQEATVKLCNTFPGAMYGIPLEGVTRTFAYTNSSASISLPSARVGYSYDFCSTYKVRVGALDVQPEGLGGWTLSAHHRYDYAGQTLYLGSGEKLTAPSMDALVVNAVAGGLTSGVGGTSCVSQGLYTAQMTADGQPAYPSCNNGSLAMLQAPNGNLMFLGLDGVRQILPNGTLQTIVGVAPPPWFLQGDSGNEGLATAARFSALRGAISMGPDGSIYILTDGLFIRKVTPDGIIHAFAGTGQTASSPDGVPALTAALNVRASERINGLLAAPDGSVYFSEPFGNRVRRVMPDGTLTTVAGDGAFGFGGDNGPATSAHLATPSGLALGPDGSLYIADRCNNRIRKVRVDGKIITVAGSGGTGCYPGFGQINYSGDGGPATNAGLQDPVSVAVARDGSIFFSDYLSRVIRRVRPTGNIDTIAGLWNGPGWTGKDTPARQMDIGPITNLALGNDGALYASSETAFGIIWKIQSAYARTVTGEALVASSDGSEIYVFDGAGHHLRTLDALTGATFLTFSYDSSGHLERVTDVDQRFTAIEHDAQGHPTAIVGPFQQRTTLAVDGNAYLAQVTNPANEIVRLDYYPPVSGVLHSGGLLSQLTDARGGIHGFGYDGAGFLLSDSSPFSGTQTLDRHSFMIPNRVTHFTALGRPTEYRVIPNASGSGQTTIVSTPDAMTTTTQWITSFLSSTTYPDGSTSSLTLSADPRFGNDAPVATSSSIHLPGSQITVPLTGSRTVTLSNPSDPLSLTQLIELASVNGRIFQSTYNRAASTITLRTPLQRQTVVTLDPVSARVTQVQPPGVAPISVHYTLGLPDSLTQGTRVYRFGYDGSGRLQTITDPLGAVLGDPAHSSVLGYDGANRVNGVSLPDGNALAAGYDANNNQTSLTPLGRSAHLFSYRADDLEEDYTPPAVDASGTGKVQTEWDLDQAVFKITPTGLSAITPHFDLVKGRLNSIDFGSRTNTFGYSSTTGQLTSIGTADGTLTYAYDGPLLASQSWSAGLVNGTVARQNAQGQSGYDANLWLKAESYGGQTVGYDYDSDGLLKLAGALTISRDLTTGVVSGTVLGNVNHAFAYNPAYGELSDAQATYQGNNLLHQHYDLREGLGRIKQKTETVLGEASHVYQYDYDSVGRLREVVKDCAGSAFPAWSSTASYLAGDCISYAGLKYRALVDQSTANQPDASLAAWERQHAYSYDANGNRLTAPGITSVPVYDAQDRMLAYGACTYAYKPDGSLQTKSCPDGTTSYDYDSFGNLRHVTLPNATNIDYLIDGQNRRIGKKVNGALVEGFFYRDQLQPVVWLNGNGTVRATFVYGLRPNVPEYMVQGGITYHLITDQVGSVRLVVNAATGVVVERIDWDEFGNLLADSAPGLQPFGFAGGLRDADTVLTRFGSRDYDAATGRWVTKDPEGLEGGINLFEYAGNDPINHIDPSGDDWRDWDVSDAANFFAGFGDQLTFGLTAYLRPDGTVDKCSAAYRWGRRTGVAWEVGMAMATFAKTMGKMGYRVVGGTRTNWIGLVKEGEGQLIHLGRHPLPMKDLIRTFGRDVAGELRNTPLSHLGIRASHYPLWPFP
jgi:RHS repeat-associated protein